MDAKVIDVNGKETGTVSLKEEIFGHKPEKRFLHEFVTIYLANQRAWSSDRKSTRLNSSHIQKSRMPSSA